MRPQAFPFTDETELVHFKDGSPDADPEAQGSTGILPSALAWEQCVTTSQPGQPYSGRTIWIRKLKTLYGSFCARKPAARWSCFLRRSLRLCGSTSTPLPTTRSGGRHSIDVGGAGVALDLRHWVNSGLMTFFFFVLGLEARREFDLGELRERRRFALPLLAAIGGMATAVAIYLAFNMGAGSAHGWGTRCRPTRPSPSASLRSWGDVFLTVSRSSSRWSW